MNRRNTYRTSLGILIVGILVIAGVVAYLFRSPAGIPAAEGSSSIASEASSVHTDPENGPGAAEKEAEASAAEGSAEEGPSEEEASKDVSSEESSSDDTSAPEEASEDGSSEEETSKEESSEEDASEEGSPEEGSSEDEASKYESSKGESSKDGSEEEQSDDWKMMLVNRWNPIPDDYTFETFELRNGQAVDKRIYEDLQAMFDAAREDGIYPYIVESYRTHEDQIAMMDYYVGVYESEGLSEEEAREKAETVVAIPGTSEHELGLAVDINGEYTDTQESAVVWDWLMDHCYDYGFILRYPEDKTDVTGIDYEPWHYRYVGRENAAKIRDSGLCLEEYLGRTEHE